MKKAHLGFTLIELMVVLAEIGIIIGIAIPTFQDYSVRTKVAEGLALVNGAKVAVEETDLANAVFPSNNSQAGVAAKNAITGNYVGSVEVGQPSDGMITITYNDAKGGTPQLENETIVMSPVTHAGSISWVCTGGTVLLRYRPALCR
ncbi:MAG: pilin [Gammaproteobacteria bacterium]